MKSKENGQIYRAASLTVEEYTVNQAIIWQIERSKEVCVNRCVFFMASWPLINAR